MATYGTEKEGFEITKVGGSSPIVQLRVWGFWRPTTVSSFAQQMPLAPVDLDGPWSLLFDCTAARTQSSESYTALVKIFTKLRTLGMKRIAVATSDSMVKLQVRRLSEESGQEGWTFHADIASARASLPTGS